VTWWLAGPLDSGRLDQARQIGPKFADLLRAGFPLRLNTTEEGTAFDAAA
jgi:hypothetical protein